jgi:hypothetical protein
MFACRLCRTPLAALSGCAVCEPMRANLVALDEDEETRPTLSAVSSELVSALRKRLRYLRGVLDETPGDETAASGLIAVGNTAAKMLESARKLQTDGLAAVESMSVVERAQLFVGWYAALPPPHRTRLRAEMDKHEASLTAPRELPAAT